jgi:DoxX-like protein
MSTNRRGSRIALWVVQGLLAALFLFAGGSKLAMPAADLARAVAPLSVGFIKFIGVCEVLGALGLVLPGLFRIRLGLTPLAATGLVIIMIGAVIVTAITHGVAAVAFPLVVGVLASVVALGRWSPSTRIA